MTLATILFPVALMLTKALAGIIANLDKQPPMTPTIFDPIGELNRPGRSGGSGLT